MTKELKSATSVKTGKKFKQRRHELGYSIGEVSKILFVNESYLSAIEQGNYTIFPSEAFAKAYFNKYLNFLEINHDFPNIFDIWSEKKHKKISKEFAFNNDFDAKTKQFVASFFLLSIILIGGYFFFSDTSSDKIKIDQQDIKLEDLSLIERNINQNQKQAQFNTNNISENSLSLNFSGECWLEVYVDNELIEAQLFSENDSYVTEIKKPFQITIGNADHVKGSYNNSEIDFITNANRLTKVNTIIFNE
tara:strand:+ start:336 stop:1082 length:747 start_codon:yes stop_codon:yes gene_type:complete